MRQLDGSVRMGSGTIHPHAQTYTEAVARRARVTVPEDTRPKYVQMRAAKDGGMTWMRLAEEFNFGDQNSARDYLLRKEREAARDIRQPGLRKDAKR